MSTERDVLAVFERANPVPDPDLVTVESDAGRYLADLLDHGPIVVGDGFISGQPAAPRNRWLLPMVAAAVVAVVVAGLVVLGGGDADTPAPADTPPVTVVDDDLLGPVPATTTSSDTATTAAPSPTSQTSEVTVPTSIPVAEDALAAVPMLPGETRASAVGDITLIRVEDDAAGLPQRVDFEYGGSFYGSDWDGTSWRSGDGTTWTQIDPTGGPAFGRYVETGGEVWTSVEASGTDERPQLLRFDGSRFIPVELPVLTEPDIPGLRPQSRSLLLSPFRGELAVIAETRYTIDFDDGFDFGDDVDVSEVRVETLGVDTLTLASIDDPNRRVGDLVVAPSEPGTMQIVSPDGTVVGRIGPWPGLDAEQLQQRLADNLAHHQILIGGDAGFDPVASPRPDAVVQSLADVDGQLLAVTYTRRSYIVEQFSLWSTSDLANWTTVDSPVPDAVDPLEANLVGNGSGAVLATVHDAWFTDDGRTWQPSDETAYDATFAADFGWAMTAPAPFSSQDGLSRGFTLAVSDDGTTWQRVPVDCPFSDSGTFSASVLGNKIFVSIFDTDDENHRLICVSTIVEP